MLNGCYTCRVQVVQLGPTITAFSRLIYCNTSKLGLLSLSIRSQMPLPIGLKIMCFPLLMHSHMWRTGNFRSNIESKILPEIRFKTICWPIVIHTSYWKTIIFWSNIGSQMTLNFRCKNAFYPIAIHWRKWKAGVLGPNNRSKMDLMSGTKTLFSIRVQWLLYMQKTSIITGSENNSHFTSDAFQHLENGDFWPNYSVLSTLSNCFQKTWFLIELYWIPNSTSNQVQNHILSNCHSFQFQPRNPYDTGRVAGR